MICRRRISYHEYGVLLDELAGRLDGEYVCIYGQPRGGLPIAVHLSHQLKLPFCLTEDDAVACCVNGHGGHILIVDDIADTGRSLAGLIDRIAGHGLTITTASLFYKPRSTVEPDIWLRQVPDEHWIVFPWECPDEEPNRAL